jgi:outer membrane receptor protein involved in Fe transport
MDLPPSTPVAELVVTGRPLPLPAGAAAYASQTIGADRLAGTASGRLEDALKDFAGLASFRRTDSRSANPTSQGLSLRALGGNAASRALVLLDGVPLADPFAGWLPFAAIDPARLASARLVRGGGGGAFGAGAVAGTLDLTSAGPESLPPLTASLAYGDRNSLEASTGLAVRLGNGFLTMSLRHDEGDGFLLVPQAQRGPVDIPARYRSTGGSLRAVVSAGRDTELQVSARAFTDTRTRGLALVGSDNSGADASLRLVHRGSWAVDALAYVQTRNFASRFAAVNATRTLVTPSLDQYRTPATGLGARLEVRPPALLNSMLALQLGLDWRHASGASNEFFRFQNGRYDGLREAGGTTSTAGAYAEASLTPSDHLTLTAGLRLDHWQITQGRLIESVIGTGQITQSLLTPERHGTRPTARAGLRWSPFPALALRTAAYTGFRLPTPNELYRPFRVGADATAANPALALERARGLDVGFDWQPLPTARLGLTLFTNSLADAISNVTIAPGPGTFPQVGFVSAAGTYRQRQNLQRITTRGLEADVLLQLASLTASLSAAYASASVRAPGLPLDGLRPAQSPAFALSATLAHASQFGTAALTLRHTASAYEDDQNQRRLPAATTLDASLRVNVTPSLALTLRAENLTNTQVISGIAANGLPDLAQPRTLWAALSYNL